MLKKIIFFGVTFFCIYTNAQSVDDLFSNGLKSYQEGRFEEAANQFEQALSQYSNNASLLYNLGLAEYKQGKTGLAIASWRKALSIDPSLSDARDALQFAFSKLERKELPHQVMLLETLRATLLQWVSLNQLFFILFLTLFAFVWTLLTWLGRRRVAQEQESSAPTLPIKVYFLGVCFFGLFSLLGLKVYDLRTPRGTIVSKTVEVRAGPDAEQASLFEIYEGLEVILGEAQNGWVKITYPGGRSGWLPEESLKRTW